jgi:hypothetical protein
MALVLTPTLILRIADWGLRMSDCRLEVERAADRERPLTVRQVVSAEVDPEVTSNILE